MRYRRMILAALTAAPPAMAADTPLLRPTRDVEVEYRTTGMPTNPLAGPMGGQGANGEASLTIHFSNKGGRMKVEAPNGIGYAIVDRDAGRMMMVMTAQRMYMELPKAMTRDTNLMASLDGNGVTFTKTGTDTVAGLKCTTYDATANEQKRQVCLTADGVLLRILGDANRRGELLAIKVTYASQPASLFEPPAEFQKVQMPAMPGGMAPGMPGGPPR